MHIHHLRRKLFPELIRTVRGVGYLVDKGFDAEQAIQMVREARPGSIETPDQEQVIHDLAARMKE